MATVQKTVMVNEDLYKLTCALEKRTGASFKRTLTAALIQYLFLEPEGPNPLWMEYAVDIENGDIDIASIIRDLSALGIRVSGTCLPDTRMGPSGEVNEISEEDSAVWKRWKRLVDRLGDEPVANIVEHWANAARKR